VAILAHLYVVVNPLLLQKSHLRRGLHTHQRGLQFLKISPEPYQSLDKAENQEYTYLGKIGNLERGTMELFLTSKQIADRLKVDRATVLYWIRKGHFPNARKAGPGRTSPYRIPETDVIAFEERLRIRQ